MTEPKRPFIIERNIDRDQRRRESAVAARRHRLSSSGRGKRGSASGGGQNQYATKRRCECGPGALSELDREGDRNCITCGHRVIPDVAV